MDDILATFWRNNALKTHESHLRAVLWELQCETIARRIKSAQAYERGAVEYYRKYGTVGEF